MNCHTFTGCFISTMDFMHYEGSKKRNWQIRDRENLQEGKWSIWKRKYDWIGFILISTIYACDIDFVILVKNITETYSWITHMDTKYTEHNLQTVYGVVNAQIKICPISIVL